MGFVGARIEGREFFHNCAALLDAVIVDLAFAQADIGDGAVIEDLAFAGIGQHQEFMGVIAADGAAVGAHRDRLQAHPLVCAQVAHEVAVIGVQRILFGQVEIVAVFHKELAPAHHTKAGTDLVPELPLNMIQRQRQVLVGGHVAAENVRDQLFVGWAIQHVAIMAVTNAQHLFAVIIIASAFAPQVGRLQCRHQHRDVTGADLLFVHDVFELAQDLEAHGQPRIDTGGRLLDHARTQHQPVAGNLGLGRGFFEDRQEIAAQTHERPLRLADREKFSRERVYAKARGQATGQKRAVGAARVNLDDLDP